MNYIMNRRHRHGPAVLLGEGKPDTRERWKSILALLALCLNSRRENNFACPASARFLVHNFYWVGRGNSNAFLKRSNFNAFSKIICKTQTIA